MNVCFTPESKHRSARWQCPLCAKSGFAITDAIAPTASRYSPQSAAPRLSKQLLAADRRPGFSLKWDICEQLTDMVTTNKSSGPFLNRPRRWKSARANHGPRSVRFEMDVWPRRCLGAPRSIHCGYYQCSSRKIAFVWIAVQITKHHVRFLKARDPRRRAARIRSLAGELAAEIDGVRNPSNISDAQRIARPGGIMWLAPSHKRVAIDEITVGILSARLHGGSA
jgi:hypothetical protein